MNLNVTKWLAPVGLAFLLAACNPAPTNNASTQAHPEQQLTGNTMGTYYSIKMVGVDQAEAETLQTEIDKRLETVNDQMSTYREDSELSRFNQFTGDGPFSVSKDTATVVAASLQLGNLTEGTLDVTVGPLVNLWGFGPDARPEHTPSQAQLDTTLEHTGLEHLRVEITSEGEYLYKDIPELYVDLSSTAKGFGVDVVSEFLAEQGVTNHLIEIGGELRMSGHNGKGRPWSIAVEQPTGGSSAQQVVHPGNNSVATSGDYRNYYEMDGRRLSHTIDPSSGEPINHALASVTVIHPSCMIADGLATALTVMGPERALAFAEEHQLAVYLLTKTDDGFRADMTSAFKKYSRG